MQTVLNGALGTQPLCRCPGVAVPGLINMMLFSVARRWTHTRASYSHQFRLNQLVHKTAAVFAWNCPTNAQYSHLTDGSVVLRCCGTAQWLKTILSILEQHQEQLQEQQQAGPQPREQHAEALQLSVQISLATQTAFRALLTNSPSATATAAGAAPEGITQLIADEAALLDICQQLPDMPVQQKLSFLQQLQALLRMLFMLSTEDISNRIFHNRVQRLIQVPFADASEAYRLDNTLDAVLQQSDPATLLVPDAESAAAAVPAAMRHVEQLQLMLDPSAEQRQELQMASVVVGQGMPPRDVRIERFWNDYEVGISWSAAATHSCSCKFEIPFKFIPTLPVHFACEEDFKPCFFGTWPCLEGMLVWRRLCWQSRHDHRRFQHWAVLHAALIRVLLCSGYWMCSRTPTPSHNTPLTQSAPWPCTSQHSKQLQATCQVARQSLWSSACGSCAAWSAMCACCTPGCSLPCSGG